MLTASHRLRTQLRPEGCSASGRQPRKFTAALARADKLEAPSPVLVYGHARGACGGLLRILCRERVFAPVERRVGRLSSTGSSDDVRRYRVSSASAGASRREGHRTVDGPRQKKVSRRARSVRERATLCGLSRYLSVELLWTVDSLTVVRPGRAPGQDERRRLGSRRDGRARRARPRLPRQARPSRRPAPSISTAARGKSSASRRGRPRGACPSRGEGVAECFRRQD